MLGINPLSNVSLTNMFSHSVSCLFLYFVDGFLFYSKPFQFDIVPFVYFLFCFPCLRRYIRKKVSLHEMPEILLPMFSSRICMVLSFTFKSLIHFEFILLHGVRRWSGFIFLQFSQHHLLNRLSLYHCMFFPPLSNIN